jgi:hypothetical protein
MFLQEIDFLYKNTKSNFTNSQEELITKLREFFLKELKLIGYNIVIESGFKKQQPLATIYKKSTFDFKKSYGGLEDTRDHSRGNCRALFTIMKHKATDQTISLINLHLIYGVSYTDIMTQLMSPLGSVTIAGGDTNHTPNEIDGLVTINEGSTTLHDEKGVLSICDDKGYPKILDGFCAAPHPEGRIKLKFGKSECFVVEDESITIKTINKKQHTMILTSEKGKPFTTIQETSTAWTESSIKKP